ncbi:MAG: hypothetical protein V3U16_03505 [Candidatus Neomarinimicrobiota bacterium]
MIKTVILGGAGILFLSMLLFGQEHPGKRVQEEITVRDIETAISDYIEKDEMLKGRFMIYDEKNEMVRLLNFERLHTVNQLDTGSFFVCADFEDQDKNKLDIDFYIDTNTEQGGLEVSKLLIHKVNGKSL